MVIVMVITTSSLQQAFETSLLIEGSRGKATVKYLYNIYEKLNSINEQTHSGAEYGVIEAELQQGLPTKFPMVHLCYSRYRVKIKKFLSHALSLGNFSLLGLA